MISTLSTTDVLAKSDAASFRTGETIRVWSAPFAELDLEKKLAIQVIRHFINASSKVEHIFS
jgi:hypothetical protein